MKPVGRRPFTHTDAQTSWMCLNVRNLIVSFCFSQSGDDSVKDDRKSLHLQDLKAGGEVR